MSLWSQGSFFLYGLSYFTKKAYQQAVLNSKNWESLVQIDCSNKAFLVTGANAGIGYECAKFFASRGGVYIL
jgi:hypothetical protein